MVVISPLLRSTPPVTMLFAVKVGIVMVTALRGNEVTPEVVGPQHFVVPPVPKVPPHLEMSESNAVLVAAVTQALVVVTLSAGPTAPVQAGPAIAMTAAVVKQLLGHSLEAALADSVEESATALTPVLA